MFRRVMRRQAASEGSIVSKSVKWSSVVPLLESGCEHTYG